MLFLYVYHCPNTMIGHKYTDDVAITWALTKKQAIKKFKKLYNLNDKEVDKVWFNSDRVAILTDY